MKTGTRSKPVGHRLVGTAVIGERGQIVIPKEARSLLKLQKGDAFVVIVNNDAIMLMPKKAMEKFIKEITKNLKI